MAALLIFRNCLHARAAAPGTQEFAERLKAFQYMVQTIAGFTAGFTYFVVNNPMVDFKNNPKFFGSDRQDVYACTVMVAFLLALAATFWSAIEYGYMNLAGPENARWFADKVHTHIASICICMRTDIYISHAHMHMHDDHRNIYGE